MFSSAAGRRSAQYVSSNAASALPFATNASFQARLSASWMPLLPPRPPKGLITWAASPANSTRPWPESRQAFAAISPRAYPDDLEIDLAAELPPQPLANRRFARGALDIAVGIELIVDAADAIRHHVLPRRATVVEWRRNPGAALARRWLRRRRHHR